VRLLTGVAFASGNLQPKLLFGSACVSYGAWRYDRLNGPPLQAFPLTFGATFVRKAGQVATLAVKPAPPLIRPLPRDLFWPFTA
jgi:tectonic-1/3